MCRIHVSSSMNIQIFSAYFWLYLINISQRQTTSTLLCPKSKTGAGAQLWTPELRFLSSRLYILPNLNHRICLLQMMLLRRNKMGKLEMQLVWRRISAHIPFLAGGWSKVEAILRGNRSYWLLAVSFLCMSSPVLPCWHGIGSFSPITLLHLRMFEMAYDYIKVHTNFEVIGSVRIPTPPRYCYLLRTESPILVSIPRRRYLQEARLSLCTESDAHVRIGHPITIQLNRSWQMGSPARRLPAHCARTRSFLRGTQ